MRRCQVRTPGRDRCGCPVRHDERGRLIHAPELETATARTIVPGDTAEARQAFHREHIDQYLHLPRVA